MIGLAVSEGVASTEAGLGGACSSSSADGDGQS